MSARTIIRLVGMVVAAGAALSITLSLNTDHAWHLAGGTIAGIACAGALIGLFITPIVTIPPYRWVVYMIRHAEVSDLVAGALGLVVGLVIAALTSVFLSQIRWLALGQWLPLVAGLLFGVLGAMTGIMRKEDFARFFSNAWGQGRAARRNSREEQEEDREDHGRLRFGKRPTRNPDRILVDTSAIIDGRIADIAETGFIYGTLVVPRFVLEELQHIADSADTMRRARGRRGLDVLQRLQKEPIVQVEISDADAENVPEVDAKLVKLARQWHCAIITNDFNLNRVAELQGVKVLNINELAHAVKPILIPGEEMQVKIMQDGKEIGQGVGYLDDGTMIVVESGKSFMGQTVDVTVTRVLQTVAGRMIFAQPKLPPASSPAPARRAGTA